MMSVRTHLEPDSREAPHMLAEIDRLHSLLEDAYATIESLQADRSNLEADLLRLRRIAATDALTGLWNRRFLIDSLQSSYSFAVRHELPLSLLLIDVDHFKSFNDGYGHAAGDVVLREVASLLQSCARNHDVVARYGGEEFAVLLPSTGRFGAEAMAERIRGALEGRSWPLRAITASVGAATLGPQDRLTDCSVSSLLEAADIALYHSKRNGRNRSTHADEVVKAESPFIPAGVVRVGG